MNYQKLVTYFDTVLNIDKSSYKNNNDEPTPIGCIENMLSKVPDKFWCKKMKILDPCCGNGNFHLVIWNILKQKKMSDTEIFRNMLVFNDINEQRLANVNTIFPNPVIWEYDFLEIEESLFGQFDMIVANPPYAKIQKNGQRAAKNHNLIKDFIHKSLQLLKDGGILVYIIPNNWMSLSDRNTLITSLTKYQFHWLDINGSKKWFPKIGSSFTWFVVEKTPFYKNFTVETKYKNKIYNDLAVKPEVRTYIPLLYTSQVQSIFSKTIDLDNEKFKVETTSDLHRTTKKILISDENTDEYQYKLIHTPKQTVWASRPHKYQDGWKVFISLTDRYQVFIDNCGMTQSIGFIRCKSYIEAEKIAKTLQHPLYVFLNNLCRWGNFNNVRILQRFPFSDEDDVYNSFSISTTEKEFIENVNM